MPNPTTATAPLATWAEVRSHDHVMRYQRSGAGPAVLVLQSADGSSTLWSGLTDALATGFRVIVPDTTPAYPDTARWLTDFLEGLGLADVAIVAAEGFCMPALELALLGMDQVARVVLVPEGRGGETGLDGSLATPMRDAAVELLVVRRGLPGAEALPLVTGFLAGKGVAPAG